MNRFIVLSLLTSLSLGLQGMDRVVKFSNIAAFPVGCGDVYVLGRNEFSSMALARQTAAGDVHVHDGFREIYHCTDGSGVVYQNENEECPIQAGDIIDIGEGQHHGLGVDGKNYVEVLVACNPPFDPEKTKVIEEKASSGRTAIRPSYFYAGRLNEDAPGAIEHDGFREEFMTIINGEYMPRSAELLCVLAGVGKFVTVNDQIVDLEKFDSVALEPGDTVTGENLKLLLLKNQ